MIQIKERFLSQKPRIVFFAGYTLLFLIASRVMLYILPFIIAFVTAVVMKPLYDALRRKFFFRSAFAATALTLLIYAAAFATVGFLLFLVVRQAIGLAENYGYLWDEYISSPQMLEQLRDALMSGNLLSLVSDVAATLLRLIPLVIIFVIITFSLTVFFLHRLGGIKAALLEKAGESRRETVGRVLSVGYRFVRRFIRSYLILYFITFVESVFIFCLLGIEYPLPFAFITAVADILPILGPGTVYLPFVVVFILQQNYVDAITLTVFFLLTAVLRQIMEPKIVGDNVKLHPLAVMTAVYLSIASMNLWVLFYVLTLFLLYKVLEEAGAFGERSG